MRSAAKFCVCILALASLASVTGARRGTVLRGSANFDRQEATPPAKPQNPLEIKAPGPGEEKAYKAFQHFQSMPESDAAKKTQAGEDFLTKFPATPYATYVYQYLTVAYIQAGQVDKGLATGEKAIQVNPQDFRTMGVLGQTIARTLTDSAPDAAAKLEKAEA